MCILFVLFVLVFFLGFLYFVVTNVDFHNLFIFEITNFFPQSMSFIHLCVCVCVSVCLCVCVYVCVCVCSLLSRVITFTILYNDL